MNAYCEVLGIDVPDLVQVKDHREANIYALLLIALVERGEAMTLAEVAERFEAAGIAPADQALRSLKRCKPGRPPVYRDGDYYALDPHSRELDLWVFRLGLRPQRVPHLTIVRPEPPPRRTAEQPLTVNELDQAWTEANLHGWSAQRLALAVLDAHGRSMKPEDVIGFVSARTQWHLLRHSAGQFGRRGAAVQICDDGAWEARRDHPALFSARTAVRELIQIRSDRDARREDPVVIVARAQFVKDRAAKRAAEASRLRHLLVRGFPDSAPKVVAIADVGERSTTTFFSESFDELRERIVEYDIVGAIDVRRLLRVLDIQVDRQRLADLGPPQKTRRLNRQGRTLTITTAMLIQGSCGIARAFGDPDKLQNYLRNGQTTKLVRRLEADLKSLVAYYEYSRLHGMVRLRWGFLDEMIPAPWCDHDEPRLYHLKQEAQDKGRLLEVVVGSAPGWAAPWTRGRLCRLLPGRTRYAPCIVDEDGFVVEDADVQRARLSVHGGERMRR